MSEVIPFPRLNVQALIELHKELITLNQDYAQHSQQGNTAAIEANNRQFEQWSRRLAIIVNRAKPSGLVL